MSWFNIVVSTEIKPQNLIVSESELPYTKT
jgi:hypothetical protein